MNEATDMLKRYLARKEDVDVDTTRCCPFVTISRQYGAGAHELGRDIVRELDARADRGWNRGWDLFDQKLCALLVKEGQLARSFESLVNEEYRHGIHQAVYEMFVGRSEEYATQRKIAEVVRFLATFGKAVIIGRGGMCAARGLGLGVNIRLVAPENIRLATVMSEQNLSYDAARRTMRDQDADRARFIRDFYGKDIQDPLLYDIVFNTAHMSLREMSRMAAELLFERMEARSRLRSKT